MLGFDRETKVVNLNDSAQLNAFLYDEEDAPFESDYSSQVIFTIRRPDNSREEIIGQILSDGTGVATYNHTDLVGEYIVVARFVYTPQPQLSPSDDLNFPSDENYPQDDIVTGQFLPSSTTFPSASSIPTTGEHNPPVVKSVRSDFSVADPFGSDITVDELENFDIADVSMQERIVSLRVWDKMEDLFDSTDGGPWMRDMTMNVFSPEKIGEFIEEAIFDINVSNPPTQFYLNQFTIPTQLQGQPPRPNPNLPLLVQGTWVAVIRHLMRSYTEQPLASGGQITFDDRRDYLQRWGTIYQIELAQYTRILALWKRQFLGLGKSKNLIANKSGRILAGPLRSRNIGRGYYMTHLPFVVLIFGYLFK